MPSARIAWSSGPPYTLAVKVGGRSTATEFPSTPAEPKAQTGKATTLCPIRKSRLAAPPWSTMSKVSWYEKLSLKKICSEKPMSTRTASGPSETVIDWGVPFDVAATFVAPGGMVIEMPA